MRKSILLFTGIFIVCFTVNVKYANAQDTPEWFREIQVNGFVSSAYTYNFNRPSDSINDIRIFDTDDNSFKPDVAELAFHKEAADPGSVGFRVDLNYGYSVPSVIHSTGMAPSNDFDLQQAYVSYNAPLGNGLLLDFGKFITHMGLEVIEGYDGWNYNYSRSILFGYAIPFTHTGIKASYNFNEVFSAMAMVVNGWDKVKDNNDSKSVCLHLGITPWKEASLSLNYVGGPEQDNNDRNWRHGVNAVLIIKPTDQWELQLNGDYGTEDAGPSNNMEWGGFEGVIRRSFTDFFAVNLRGEYFDDNDGARTGTSQELWEVTLTPELIVSGNMVVRAEYRHDESSVGFFDDHGRAEKSQDTVALNVIFHF